MNSQETLTIEMQMHAYRLMRTGRYRLAKEISAAMAEDFPDVPKEEINRALAMLARRLTEEA